MNEAEWNFYVFDMNRKKSNLRIELLFHKINFIWKENIISSSSKWCDNKYTALKHIYLTNIFNGRIKFLKWLRMMTIIKFFSKGKIKGAGAHINNSCYQSWKVPSSNRTGNIGGLKFSTNKNRAFLPNKLGSIRRKSFITKVWVGIFRTGNRRVRNPNLKRWKRKILIVYIWQRNASGSE